MKDIYSDLNGEVVVTELGCNYVCKSKDCDSCPLNRGEGNELPPSTGGVVE